MPIAGCNYLALGKILESLLAFWMRAVYLVIRETNEYRSNLNVSRESKSKLSLYL